MRALITVTNKTTFDEVLAEQGYTGAATQVNYDCYAIPCDLSVEFRNLCADLLDEGFHIELGVG